MQMEQSSAQNITNQPIKKLKRINTTRKGNRTQQKAKKFYESYGYQVEVVRRDKWRKDQDFFGLWDLICVKEDDIRFVQVKTNARPTAEWLGKAGAWKCPKTAAKEYVVFKDYQREKEPAERNVYL